MSAGACIWDMVTIKDGKREYTSVWSEKYAQFWNHFRIEHSPDNHHRFPAYVRDAVKW